MRFFCTAVLWCLCAALPMAWWAPADAAPKRNLVLYSALTATTPQMPLWGVIRNEGWPRGFTVRPEYWKNLDDLRGAMLAGKGDLWVGHLEGFAQAALRGAPVTLVAVTGWKKFHVIAPETSGVKTMEDLASELRREGVPLAVTPQDSPALGVLETIRERGGPSFAIAAMQPQQLMLEMLRGSRRYALLPEPLVSAILAKKPKLRVLMGLEAEFARLYGGAARLPFVGIAVNTRFAAKNAELVRELVAAMQRQDAYLAGDFGAALAVLPKEVREGLGDAVIRASLERDMIFTAPAAEVQDEIASFLRMVLPDAKTAPSAFAALLEGPFLFRGK